MIKRLLATDERRLLHGCHRRFKKEIRKIYAISLLLNSEENYKKKNRELKKKKKQLNSLAIGIKKERNKKSRE
jgi:hypothetical protein